MVPSGLMLRVQPQVFQPSTLLSLAVAEAALGKTPATGKVVGAAEPEGIAVMFLASLAGRTSRLNTLWHYRRGLPIRLPSALVALARPQVKATGHRGQTLD